MSHFLSGSWRLHYSTFPIWQKEGISNVTFHYTPSQRDGKAILIDEVKYLKKERERTIKGYDHPDALDQYAYTWRGAGILRIFTNKWRIEWMSDAENCIIISFARTFITPAGIDILTKNGTGSETILQEALDVVASKSLMNQLNNPLLPVA